MRHLLHSPLAWILAASLLLWLGAVWQFLRRRSSGDTPSPSSPPSPAGASLKLQPTASSAAHGGAPTSETDPSIPSSKTIHPPSTITNQQSKISHPASPIPHPPSTISHQPSPVPFQLFLLLFLPLWLFVYTLSTPLGSDTLRRTLTTHWPVPADFSPDYILVAAMGHIPAGDPSGDVLSEGTAARIAEAARWWEQHPHAFLVMQGASGRPDLGDDHQGRLMQRFATAYGVPAEQILLEPRSRNTREHVSCFLAFEQVDPATPVGVVTSDWHMRRTAREFRGSFETVHFRATYSPVVRGVSVRNLTPRERNLHVSSLYLREWIATVYYRLR